MAKQLTHSEMKEAFRLFDLNKDGRITMEELRTVMSLLGQVFTEAELVEILKQLDEDGNGTIDFEEFKSGMAQVMTIEDIRKEVEDEVWKAFCAFDKDQNGFLSCEELFNVMKSLGEMPSEKEVQDMIEQADIDGDGFISFMEFHKIMI